MRALGRASALAALLAIGGALLLQQGEAAADSYRRRRARSAATDGYRLRRNARRAPPPPPPFLLLARKAAVAGKLGEALRQLRLARDCWSTKLQPAQQCGFTRDRYQLVAGIVYLERGQPLLAIRSLEASLKVKPAQPAAWLYLGQALYRAERYGRAVEALRRALEIGRDRVGYHMLLARSLEHAGRAEAARATLASALQRFPKNTQLLREATSIYAGQGLYMTAATMTRPLWRRARGDARRTLALMMADYLRKGGRRQQALALLERTRLRYPRDATVALRLAYTYADAGQPRAAARLGARVFAARPAIATFVAEQYRLAGRWQRALSWSAAIVDRRQRLRQRATILLAAQSWHRATIALEKLLERGLLGERGRYQLAYAALKARRLPLAQRALGGLPRTATVARLRAALQSCQREVATCP